MEATNVHIECLMWTDVKLLQRRERINEIPRHRLRARCQGVPLDRRQVHRPPSALFRATVTIIALTSGLKFGHRATPSAKSGQAASAEGNVLVRAGKRGARGEVPMYSAYRTPMIDERTPRWACLRVSILDHRLNKKNVRRLGGRAIHFRYGAPCCSSHPGRPRGDDRRKPMDGTMPP
jgi:hypothetical protein